MISFLRLVANPRDEVAFKRMVKLLPGIGNRSAEHLWTAWDKSVAGIGDPGAEKTSIPPGIADTGYSFGQLLRAMNPPSRSAKHWTQLAHTLDEIAPGGQPNPPSEMITSVVEAIYDDYAKVNFTNYELRKEDLDQLAAFSQQFNIRADRGNSDFDQRHNLVFYSIWDLPAPFSGTKVGRVFRDWRFSQLAAFRSGFPYSVRNAAS